MNINEPLKINDEMAHWASMLAKAAVTRDESKVALSQAIAKTKEAADNGTSTDSQSIMASLHMSDAEDRYSIVSRSLMAAAKKENPAFFLIPHGDSYWRKFTEADDKFKTLLNEFVAGVAKKEGISLPQQDAYYSLSAERMQG